MNRQYKRTDVAIAGCFFLLGLYLAGSGAALPAGAGIFPRILGFVMLALSAGLLLQGIRSTAPQGAPAGHIGVILGVTLLTAVYLVLWGVGLFPLRTFVYITIFLRLLGETWRKGMAVSGVLTAVVTAAFQYGLNLSLD